MNNYDTCQKNLAGRNRMEDLFSVCGKIRLRKGEGRTLKAGGAGYMITKLNGCLTE